MAKHEIEAGVILVVACKLGNLRPLAMQKDTQNPQVF